MAKYDKDGRQIPDTRPVETPLNFRAPPTINQMIQQMVRTELSKNAQEQGFESFEESEDFDIEDDPDPVSDYEFIEMQREVFDVDASDSDVPGSTGNSGRDSESEGDVKPGEDGQPGDVANSGDSE